MSNTLVFDVGKTHIKLQLLDASFRTLCVSETTNAVATCAAGYDCADTDRIWCWFVDTVRDLLAEHSIDHISITTHGATAALIDRELGGDGLVLPVMDYEWAGVEALDDKYQAVRPEFSESGSPDLPAGLNFGRQLYFLAQTQPDAFASVTDILMYPQFWVWRLTGRCFSEVSSLGCHTDLWAPWESTFSSLVTKCNWQSKFPAMANAWDAAGKVCAEVSQKTGLSTDCLVSVGVHDSNAGYLRYLHALPNQAFSLVSTGTWSIAMESQADRARLQPAKDMLANVDVRSTPVVCSRFMGGREFALVCAELGGELDAKIDETQIEQLLSSEVFCLPTWQPGTGPFGQSKPRIEGEIPAQIQPSALASLYCALMLDYQLDLLESSSLVIIEGAFLKNTLLCRMLAQLRGGQQVMASVDAGATVMGTALLSHWHDVPKGLELSTIGPTSLRGLESYRQAWRELVK